MPRLNIGKLISPFCSFSWHVKAAARNKDSRREGPGTEEKTEETETGSGRPRTSPYLCLRLFNFNPTVLENKF
ncbi:MAG: hypothetical protein O3B01_03415, partial [Planctomycetota bacterium]|nr:hypothetical protein [Planctomycetota bacterium]